MKKFLILGLIPLLLMVPSLSVAFGGHMTIVDTYYHCKSEITQSIEHELKNPLNLSLIKNRIFGIANECIKSTQHTIGSVDPCVLMNDEEYVLNQIESLEELGKMSEISEMSKKLEMSKWICSSDTIDDEFNISKKFFIAKEQYDLEQEQREIEIKAMIEYNKGRLVWDTSCSQKGILMISNVKEYSEDGITLENIDIYNYQIYDDEFNILEQKMGHGGDLVLSHKIYPEARHVMLFGEKNVYETQKICSNYFAINNLDLEVICPSFQNYDVIENPSSDDEQYTFIPKNDAYLKINPKNAGSFQIIANAYYENGEIVSTGISHPIPIKNDGMMLSYVLVTSDNFYSKEIPYTCSPNSSMKKILISEYKQDKEALEKIEESKNFCNDLISGCRVSYNVDYRINAPNEYFQKLWFEDSVQNVKRVDYSFGSPSKNSYYYQITTQTHDNQQFKDSGTQSYDMGSVLIMKAGSYWDDGIDYSSEIKMMNIAGHTREIVHYWIEEEIDSFIGITNIRQDYYYDYDTGLLLKHESDREVLDVAGVTNTDEFKMEAASVNFPKQNSGMGGGCLIATATFDSELAPQVQKLREIRDSKLLATESGSAFMESFNQFYYSFSPIIADYERENPVFKEMVKMGVTPLLTTLSLMDYAESESEVLGIGIGVILLNLGMYVGVPVFAIMRIRK